jgi:hypothetical protein
MGVQLAVGSWQKKKRGSEETRKRRREARRLPFTFETTSFLLANINIKVVIQTIGSGKEAFQMARMRLLGVPEHPA